MPLKSVSVLVSQKYRVIAGAVFLVVIVGLLYWQSQKSPETGKSTADLAAENIAKSENPFESESALAEVEADPLAKTKAVLNPF